MIGLGILHVTNNCALLNPNLSHFLMETFHFCTGEINTSVIKEILMKLDDEITEDDVDEMIYVIRHS